MSDFQPAFLNTMTWEDPNHDGQITPDPTKSDPHAVARFGINSASHPEAVADGFYTMSYDDAFQYAASLYRNVYWKGIQGSSINYQSVANKVFDLSVDMYFRKAIKILQAALGFAGDSVDGFMGTLTLGATNKADPGVLLTSIRNGAASEYRAIAAANPSEAGNLAGWLRRAES